MKFDTSSKNVTFGVIVTSGLKMWDRHISSASLSQLRGVVADFSKYKRAKIYMHINYVNYIPTISACWLYMDICRDILRSLITLPIKSSASPYFMVIFNTRLSRLFLADFNLIQRHISFLNFVYPRQNVYLIILGSLYSKPFVSNKNWLRVFANGPGDWGSVSGRIIPKTLKMVLDTS